MHIVNCIVSIKNDLRHQVFKTGIPVAEVAVLQVIHGRDAVREIEPVDTVKADMALLHTEMQKKYRAHRDLVVSLWRDLGGKYPTDLRELAVSKSAFKVRAAADPLDDLDEFDAAHGDGPDEVVEKPKAKKPGRPKKAAAKKPEPEPEAEVEVEVKFEDSEPDEIRFGD